MSPMPMGPGTGMSAVSRPHVAASFVFVWTAMMVAMMLPSLSPTLWRYRRALAAADAPHPGRQTLAFGAAYAAVWAAAGAVVFAVQLALALAARWPSLMRVESFAASLVVAAAGLVQLSRWKAHHLATCRAPAARRHSTWRDGLHLGVHCTMSCSGLTAVLLVVGLMDPWAMAVVTAAVTAERTLPFPLGARVARATGALALGAAALMAIRML